MPHNEERLLRDACIRHLRCELLNSGCSTYTTPFTRDRRRLSCVVVSLFEQGNCTINVDNQTHRCDAGSMAVIHEFRNHDYRCSQQTSKPFKESWMCARFRIFGTVDLLQLLDLPPVITKKSNADLQRVLRKIIRINENKTIISVDQALEEQALLRDFLRLLLRLAPLKLSDERLQALMRILPALEYIQQYYREDYKRDVLASCAKLANSRFHELFKKALFCSPVVYRNHLRLQEAKRLLNSSDDSIQDIATQVGFIDPFNFSRLFKRTYGLSPRNWRHSKNAGDI
ncbi:MAG: helix-turn-helix transcriptional regulator [Planctomycetes bacterium]|nr:helix-turn-helix transcriptional regulator [Planctomycetota bacterium]